MPIKKGDYVKVEYHGTLDDGTVLDSSENHCDPLVFEAGCNQVIPGFDKAILEMEPGEEKEIKIEAADAYGDVKLELIQKVSKEHVPEGQDIEKGMMLMVEMPNGGQIPATITEIEEETLTIDLNHPLAGKNLNFKLKLIEICDKPPETEGCGCDCTSCGDEPESTEPEPKTDE